DYYCGLWDSDSDHPLF
nr:immunoglobulin light chain junction region [Macaca mulatta]MOX73054.1 immunoglobulin light chain junction region [Macaca mulatta]MOX74397.1 immunoglobulin light chain junction region [Macaca mulatta]MOX75310.1 immunoglobulin light chain junction region [Macaca mulatta]MOX76267.1 immunoglobulin light chain junction region [Macaca mulatta]